MINTDLDFETLYSEYTKNRRIVIPNFFDTKFAEIVYKGFLDLDEKNLWYQANYGSPQYYDKNLEKKDFLFKHFSYRCERYPLTNFKLSDLLGHDSRRTIKGTANISEAHPETELPEFHSLRKASNFFNSKQMHDFVSHLTDIKLTYNKLQCFASKYSAGDFLRIHADGVFGEVTPRKVAFVMNMTKDWVVHWGGALAILDEQGENIIDTYAPKFNSLVLFDVPLTHTVLPVCNYAKENRYTLTGWFYYFGD